MGQVCVQHRAAAHERHHGQDFVTQFWIPFGNTKRLGQAAEGPKKRFLCSLTSQHPGIRSSGERFCVMEESLALLGILACLQLHIKIREARSSYAGSYQ